MKKIFYFGIIFVLICAAIIYIKKQPHDIQFEVKLVCTEESDCQLVENTATGEKLYVEKTSIISITDIKSAKLEDTSPSIVRLFFTKDGRDKFFNSTSKNVGKRFAVIINGELMMAPEIVEPIDGESIQIIIEAEEQKSRDIVNAINK